MLLLPYTRVQRGHSFSWESACFALGFEAGATESPDVQSPCRGPRMGSSDELSACETAAAANGSVRESTL